MSSRAGLGAAGGGSPGPPALGAPPPRPRQAPARGQRQRHRQQPAHLGHGRAGQARKDRPCLRLGLAWDRGQPDVGQQGPGAMAAPARPVPDLVLVQPGLPFPRRSAGSRSPPGRRSPPGHRRSRTRRPAVGPGRHRPLSRPGRAAAAGGPGWPPPPPPPPASRSRAPPGRAGLAPALQVVEGGHPIRRGDTHPAGMVGPGQSRVAVVGPGPGSAAGSRRASRPAPRC